MSTSLLILAFGCSCGYGFVDVSVDNKTQTKETLEPFFSGFLTALAPYMFDLATTESLDKQFDVKLGNWMDAVNSGGWERMSKKNERAHIPMDCPDGESDGCHQGDPGSNRNPGEQYWSGIDKDVPPSDINTFWEALSAMRPDAYQQIQQFRTDDQFWISFGVFTPVFVKTYEKGYKKLVAQWGSMTAAFTDFYNLDMEHGFRRIAIGAAYYAKDTCYPWHSHLAQEFYIDLGKDLEGKQRSHSNVFATRKDCGIQSYVDLPCDECEALQVNYQPANCPHEMHASFAGSQYDWWGMYMWVFPEMSPEFYFGNDKVPGWGIGKGADAMGGGAVAEGLSKATPSGQLEDSIIASNFYRFAGGSTVDPTPEGLVSHCVGVHSAEALTVPGKKITKAHSTGDLPTGGKLAVLS